MSNELVTGMNWASNHPSWQRDYYSLLLLETLRTKSILVPYSAVKIDHQAGKTGTVVYTEVYDTEPNWNGLSESGIWLDGAHLDSRTISVDLAIHGDTLKFSDYSEVVSYVNSGNIEGLVRNKIGVNQSDYLDILARNAYLAHPDKVFGGSKSSRANLAAGDLFDPDLAELARVHLEENEVPGVNNPEDASAGAIVCITTPRVIYDIRTDAGSDWVDVNNYQSTGRKFTREVGMWGGVRFVRTNRMRLDNHGAVAAQSALNGATVVGQGASATVDTVYSPGQSTSTRYVTVDNGALFSVGDIVTIHSATVSASGEPPLETDGTQETRRITGIATNQISFNKPLLKPHADDDWMTTGIDVHASVFLGGPSVVYAVGEMPHYVQPPKYDDLMMVNRYGWRGFLNFAMFRPEYFEVVESAGSTS